MRFEKLKVWQDSCRLSVEITKIFSTCSNYSLKDQITRSALSIPSNIAEGEERQSNKDTSRFYYYSKGSCGELVTQLYIAIELGYIDKTKGLLLVQDVKKIAAVIAKLIQRKSKP
ncbi:four helix bundle protein [Vibrio algarum]|uniref:Four helix bundle protein n=1 Tax=Vibrio algarum TaxID=3020714 RepID=A0ABT4YLK7_9VIBR|nr:four helix bundle protein [Vibrio sp. KJ40-1]MDB1122405.1 four helix bundle protein [Vibrio sp. KJ40-1]